MAARTLSIKKRGLNFETFMWAFTRFTVIAMYGLIIVGILGGLRLSMITGVNFGDQPPTVTLDTVPLILTTSADSVVTGLLPASASATVIALPSALENTRAVSSLVV